MKSRLRQLEHILQFHAFELVGQPSRLAALARMKPDDMKEMAADFGREIVRKLYGRQT